MLTLAFVPLHNRLWRRDVTGAFRPEARAFAEQHCGSLVGIDNRAPEPLRLAETADVLGQQAERSVDCVAFFCHGTPTSLQLAGGLGATGLLGGLLARALQPGGSVSLYACSTGARVDSSGFACRLRNRILNASLVARHGPPWRGWIDAHDRAGHTTRNPWVRRFDADGSCGWLVDPTGPQWRMWRARLQSRDDSLRLGFHLVPRGLLEIGPVAT